MRKVLVIVDMQNDFVSGSLGSPQAQAIVPNVVKKLQDWEGGSDLHLGHSLRRLFRNF